MTSQSVRRATPATVFDLGGFSLSDMVRCGAELRAAAAVAVDTRAAAEHTVRYLHGSFVDGATGGSAFPLLRMFVTRRFAALDDDLQRYVRARLPAGQVYPDLRCLVLLASQGEEAAWCDPERSVDHRVLPLPDAAAVRAAPMLAGLLGELGLDFDAVTRRQGSGPPDPRYGTFGVFHVTDAVGSPLIPDQDFVRDHGVRSVLGFGGGLPDGEFFTVLAFARVPVDAATADLFRTVALNVRLGLLAHLRATPDERQTAVAELLAVLEATSAAQAARLEDTVTQLSRTTERLRHSELELRERERLLREEADIAEALHSVGRDLATDLDLDRVVQRATDASTRLTGAGYGAFFYNVLDELGESYQLYALSGVSREAFAGLPMPRNTAVFAPTFHGIGVVRSPDITKDVRYGHNEPHFGVPVGHLPVRSYLAVPVASPAGEVLGGFFFAHPEPDRFTERHERLAVGVAAQAAIALDNARLYQRQRLAVVELQRSLLPRIPSADGLQITSRYLPSARGAQVGGDWMDLISLSSGRFGLVVGDVMGKGMHAAAVMGQLRTAIRAYAALELPPGQLIRQLNTTAVLADSEIATCLYAVLDTVNQTLTFTSAGHLPPVLREPDGTVRLLEQQSGPPLGVADSPYPSHTIALPAGSVLLLYTDGLVERRNRDLYHQLRHLASQVHEQKFRPTAEDVDRLLAAVVDTTRHDDDIALLAIRQIPEEVPLSATLRLPAMPHVSGRARAFTRQRMAEWGGAEAQVDAVVAVVSELVANAILHARTSLLELRLHRLTDRIAVEVADQDARQPLLTEVDSDDEHHRGLHLVQAHAIRWGTRPEKAGKVVWAELSHPRA